MKPSLTVWNRKSPNPKHLNMVSPRDLITWMFLLIDPQDPSDQMTKFVLKNTFLGRVMKSQSVRCSVMSTSVWPLDCSLSDSSVHGNSPGRNTGVVGIPVSRGSSWLRDQTWVSCIAGRLYHLSHQGSPRDWLRECFFASIPKLPEWPEALQDKFSWNGLEPRSKIFPEASSFPVASYFVPQI